MAGIAGGEVLTYSSGVRMPNITFASLEEVPDGLKEHAKQTDGKFVINVVPEARLIEFRENNIRISQERDGLASIFGKLKPIVGDDIDGFMTQHGELSRIAQQVKDGKLQASDAIATEVENRVAQMKTGYESQLVQKSTEAATWQTKAADAETKFNRSIIERAVTDAVVSEKSGANPGALSDIITRANRVFQVGADGKLIAKDGEAIIYGADGTSPMTPMEWMGKLRNEAPYLFKNSNGGGASGGNSANGLGGLSQADIAKLSPEAKLRLYHQSKKSK